MLMNKQAVTYWEEWAIAVGQGWNQFWFTPAQSQPLAVVRIATGLLAMVYFLTFTGDLTRWLAPDSLLPQETVNRLLGGDAEGVRNYRYSLLSLATKSNELWIFHSLALAAAALLAAGLFSRAAAAVTLVMLLSYVHRVPMISGLAEPILCPLLFYLCFAPSGEWFGVNAWLKRRKTGENPQPSVFANLCLQLIQVHLAALVFMMGMSKLAQQPWWVGDAMWYLLAQTRSRPFDLTFLRGSPFVLNAWAHTIVAFEFAFPILIWNRFARPLLLIVGTILWLSIALASGHLIFALAMIAASVAFWQWSVPVTE